MHSKKSRPAPKRTALEPQRRRGKLRVAALLESGFAVIAEKGFEAATMAEIAARAGAPIGSLYRFFPNKEILAEALIRQRSERLEEAFAKFGPEVRKWSSTMLADALLDLMLELHGEKRSVAVLLDVDPSRRRKLRNIVRQHIARILRLRTPKLSPTVAENMAVVLLHAMKIMVRLGEEESAEKCASARTELRTMIQLYLSGKLGI